MKKSFYENGRMKFYQRQQIIELDASTFSAIAITMVVFFFSGVILIMLNAIDLLPAAIFHKATAKDTKHFNADTGDSQPLEIAFIETPIKQTILPQVEAKVEKEPKAKTVVKEVATETEKIIVNEHKKAPPPRPLKKKLLVNNKKEVIKPKKKETIKKELPQIPASSADSNQTFLVKSKLTEDETHTERRIRFYLTAQVQQKINLYKEYIPDKYKYIGASYIMKVELNKNQKAKKITLSTSNNKFLNLYVIRTFDTIEYPPIEKYKLEKYIHTFVIYYRPLVRK